MADGNRKKERKTLQLVKCDATQWAIDDKYKNQLESTIHSLYCIEQEQFENISLAGNYFANHFAFLEFNLHVCYGQENNCAS